MNPKFYCKFCNQLLSFQYNTPIHTNKILHHPNVYHCTSCLTNFNSLSQTTISKYRIFHLPYTKNVPPIIAQELIFNSIALDLDFPDNKAYIGKYIPIKDDFNHQNCSVYSVITDLPIFSIDNLSPKEIFQKLKLYMILQ